MRYFYIALLLVFSLILTSCKSKTADRVDSIPQSEVNETDEVMTQAVAYAGPININLITITDDSDLANYSDYYSVYLHANYSERFLFTTDKPAKDFEIVEFSHIDEPFSLFVSNVFKRVELLPERPVLVYAHGVSMIPSWGISYTSQEKIWQFIGESGMDGSYYLLGFKPKN